MAALAMKVLRRPDAHKRLPCLGPLFVHSGLTLGLRGPSDGSFPRHSVRIDASQLLLGYDAVVPFARRELT